MQTLWLCYTILIPYLISAYSFENKDINKLERNVVGQPPLIITYETGKFYSTLQKDNFLKLKQQRVNVYQAIIVLKGNSNYKLFMKQYGNVFHYYDEV